MNTGCVVGFESLTSAVNLVLPELVLIATMCVMLLSAPFLVSETGAAAPGIRHRWGVLALLAIGGAAWFWVNTLLVPVNDGPFRLDGLTYFIRGTTLAFGAVISLMLWSQVEDSKSAECQALLLAMLAGINFTVAANDLVVMFLGLELVSIPTYVLLALPRRDRENQEATIKYFLLSIFSSAVLLYGFALLYGATGSTHFTGIAASVGGTRLSELPLLIPTAIALIVAGLSFRVTAVPFHFYAPDVFQGSPAFAAGLLSLLPKVVGFGALMRLLSLAIGDDSFRGQLDLLGSMVKPLLAMLAVLTMLVGNLMALRQTSLHRMMAYSSVAHAGYMLVGLTIGDRGTLATGVAALLFYLVSYGIMTLGVFAVLCAISSADRPVRTLNDLGGISRHHPAAAFMLAVMLFSLAGLPPSPGFLGKLNLFLAAWSEGTDLGRYLSYLMIFNAAVSAYYYLRALAAAYLKPGTGPTTTHMPVPAAAAAIACTIATLVVFIAPQRIWDAAQMKVKLIPASTMASTAPSTFVPDSGTPSPLGAPSSMRSPFSMGGRGRGGPSMGAPGSSPMSEASRGETRNLRPPTE